MEYRNLTEALMSSGLAFLSSLISLPPPEDKIYLIEDEVGRPQGFGDETCFLTEALKGYANAQSYPKPRAKALPSWEAKFVNDQEEDGPNAAWPWSTRILGDQSRCKLVFECKAESLGSWGYVMWDVSRLESLKILENQALSYGEHGPYLWHGKLLTDIN